MCMQKFLYFIISIALVVPNAVFAASTLPSAETKLVKNITYNSATIYGTVSPGTAEDNAYWFEWGVVGQDDAENTFKTTRKTIGKTSGRRDVYAIVKGLAPSTQYYFRVVSENQSGTRSGSTTYFTTRKLDDKRQSVVVATTRNTINIKEESATIFGHVATHESSATAWFEYGSDDKLEFSTKVRSVGKTGGEITDRLSNLIPGTTYYYRAMAEGDRGVVKGEIRTFKTTGTKPQVEVKKPQQTQAVDTKTSKTAVSSTKEKNTNKSLLANMFGFSSGDEEKETSKSKDLSNTESVGDATKDVSIYVKSISESKNSQTVEYEISYKYNRKEAGTKAEIKTTLPKTLIYAGDSTNGEMLVMDEDNGLKTYILPIGNVKKGDSGKFSITCIKESDIKNAPKITSIFSFVSKSEGLLEAKSQVAGVASSNNGNGSSFPTAAIILIIVLIVIAGSISLMLKAKDMYKEALARADEEKNKKDEITKKIEDNLSNQDSKNYGIVDEKSTLSTHSNPVPMKPKIIDEYEKSDNVLAVGLPGMEVV